MLRMNKNKSLSKRHKLTKIIVEKNIAQYHNFIWLMLIFIRTNKHEKKLLLNIILGLLL